MSGGNPKPAWMSAILAGLLTLGGCREATGVHGLAMAEATTSTSANAVPQDSLPADPPCPDDVTAVLGSGVVVRFTGSADDDPDACVQRWTGQSHRYYLGFWGNGRFGHGTPQQRQALAAVLGGPVGAKTTVALQGRTTGRMWKSATVTHVADTLLPVGHRTRPVVKIRVVRRDALGRNDVTAERLYWLDRATGIPLKKGTVTRTADGHVSRLTTWHVLALRSGNPDAAAPDGEVSNLH